MATKPPAELLTCAGEPTAPGLPPYEWDRALQAPTVQAAVEMMRAVAGRRDGLTLPYVLALRAAWGECHANLAGVRAWSAALPD